MAMAWFHPKKAHDGVASSSQSAGGQVSAPGASSDSGVEDNPRFSLKHRLHQELLTAVSMGQREQLTEQELRAELRKLLESLSRQQGESLGLPDQEALIEQVVNEVFGYGPIDGLMRDHEVSDILINGPWQVFVEKRGQLQAAEVSFRDEDHLVQVTRRIIASTGRQLDEKSPMVDARLPDGSRLNAVLKPPALNGPLVSIRRFGIRPLTVEDLLANQSLTQEMLDFLAACVKARINLIVSGGSGTGKTTLLNALSRYIPHSERLVTVEDTAELELQQPHVAKMEAQLGNRDGEGAVSLPDLVKNSLRMRPDRIIVGECRGAEVLDMLQAMNTGHEGSLTTIHANSSREALSRVEVMIGVAGSDIPVWAIRKLVASSINLVVQVARLPGGQRKVVTISEVTGTETDVISMHNLFEFVQTGVDDNYVVEGFFRATGNRPQCLTKMNVRGAAVSPDLFTPRRLQPQQNGEAHR
jgi:pilus assembly protein CpaF